MTCSPVPICKPMMKPQMSMYCGAYKIEGGGDKQECRIVLLDAVGRYLTRDQIVRAERK